MTKSDDFSSLFESSRGSAGERSSRHLEAGQVVDAVVLEIAEDLVFVDVGTAQDGRIERAEFGGKVPEVGASVRLTVRDPSPEGPLLTLGLGRGGGKVDLGALKLANEAGTVLQGEVVRAVKGGIEVRIQGIAAFCPASQLELGYTGDLQEYVGQKLEFKVLELREESNSVILSRRLVLQEAQRALQAQILDTVKPGMEVEGVITTLTKHGAAVDVRGVSGFVHISELSDKRVERVEDVVNVGERVKAKVLVVEPDKKGLRLRLSLKKMTQAGHAPGPEEILQATVDRAAKHGVIVDTPKGSGLVPLRELGLPPGADHRRAFPQGKGLRVVTLKRDSKDGKLTFSAVKVAGVEERNNFREFSETKPQATEGLGSLGDLLRSKLGIQAPAETPTAPQPPAEPAPADAPKPPSTSPSGAEKEAPKPPSTSPSGAEKKARAEKLERAGVVRRRKS